MKIAAPVEKSAAGTCHGHRGIRFRVPELQVSSHTVVVCGDHQGVSGYRHGAGIFSHRHHRRKAWEIRLENEDGDQQCDTSCYPKDDIANDAVPANRASTRVTTKNENPSFVAAAPAPAPVSGLKSSKASCSPGMSVLSVLRAAPISRRFRPVALWIASG